MADRKMSAVRLADLMGVHRVTVSEWANKDKIPSFKDFHDTLDRLCEYLDCEPYELIERTKNNRD